MGACNTLSNSGNKVATCTFCNSAAAEYVARDCNTTAAACESCLTLEAKRTNKPLPGYLAYLRRMNVNLVSLTPTCDCCKSAAAHWVVTEPTDVTPMGVRYCDYCATATSAGMERF
jgi:hypothetical protein